MRKYDEVMEHIAVTSEMRERILHSIPQAVQAEKGRSAVMRFPDPARLAALAACLAVVLVGVLAGVLKQQVPLDEPEVLLPSVVTEVSSAEALSRLAGFAVSDLKGLPFTPEAAAYSLIGELAQIEYQAGEEQLVYRKARGTEDISGDYNSYEQREMLEADGMDVTICGNADRFYLAVWTDGEFAYSISSSLGLERGELQNMIENAGQ